MNDISMLSDNTTVDVIAVGAGAAGLSAAVTASEGGASVMVLEKMKIPGGTSNWAEGIFAVESRHQLRKNIAITKEETFKNIMDYSHWKADPRLVRAFVERSPDTIQWLEALGVEFSDVRTYVFGGMMTWHIFKKRGASVVKALAERLRRNSGAIVLSTPVKKLLLNEKGEISGVMARNREGREIRVNTRAVIVSTGGFANDREMLSQYTDAAPHTVAVGNTGKTGDGLRMAWAVGAAEAGAAVLQLRGPMMEGETIGTTLNAATKQPFLWINPAGERFADESIVSNFPHAGNALARQPGQILYLIFDEDTKMDLMERGIQVPVGDYALVGTKLSDLDAELERGMAKRLVFVSDSLEELAQRIEVDTEKLLATVDEYNTMCDRREDSLFGKKPKFMRPVRQPAFYALKLAPSILGTLGGIKINHNTEVLDTGGRIIPGLYAAGNDAGGMYGDTYDLVLSPGSTFGFAVNAGRIAGENILRYLNV